MIHLHGMSKGNVPNCLLLFKDCSPRKSLGQFKALFELSGMICIKHFGSVEEQ